MSRERPSDVPAPPGIEDPVQVSLARALAGQYRIVRQLGRGGMGAVYLAREEALERLVAVKVLPSASENDAASRERFRREARTAARLAHPNIVPLHGFGVAEGNLYLVMGYVHGESLAAHIKRRGRIPAEEARRILADVAEALDYAHRRGIVHRDVKPDNILIDDETGRALLADFGIAKALDDSDGMTRAGAIVGTPLYMSPEQARGEDLDGRSDLYSLGAVGHAMLSGRAPFEASGTAKEAFLKRLTQDPPPLRTLVPDLPSDLGEAIDRCLVGSRDRRFKDARALRLAIAPSALDDDQLPEPLDTLDGKVVTFGLLLTALVIAGLQLAGHVVEHDYRVARQEQVRAGALQLVASLTLLGLFAMQVPMLTSAAGAARRRGFSWAQIGGAFCRQPRGWPCFWYPRRFRRRDDVWDRLPSPFRIWRWVASIAVVDLVLGIVVASLLYVIRFMDPAVLQRLGPGMARLMQNGVVTGMLAVLFGLPLLGAIAIGALWRGARLMRSHGLPTYELRRISRAFLSGPTGDRALWRKPELARLLLPPAGAGPRPPTSAAEYPAALAQVAARAGDGVRPLAERAVAAAVALSRVLADDASRIGALEREQDAGELERLDQRLAALGPEAGEDGDRRELRELLERQRALLSRREERLGQLRTRRDEALRRLEELWRGAAALETDDRGGRALAAVVAAETFVGGSPPAGDPLSSEQTRVRGEEEM